MGIRIPMTAVQGQHNSRYMIAPSSVVSLLTPTAMSNLRFSWGLALYHVSENPVVSILSIGTYRQTTL